MNLVDGMEAFMHVSDTGSFAAAARKLNVSPSAVSKLVAKTEEELGSRLLNRNTRRLSLTCEGEMFLERCRLILSELASAREELSSISTVPGGKLRVSMPDMPSFFGPIISTFMERYPAVTLELDFSDRLVDVIDEGFDVVFRVANLADSRLTARLLGNCAMKLVASPDYLRQHGVPSCTEDLVEHICIHYRYPSSGKTEPWPLSETTVRQPSLNTSFVCNSTELNLGLALQGKGIAFMARFLVEDHIKSGRLSTVLEGKVEQSYSMNLVWPTRKHMPPRLRAFISHVSGYFTEMC
ncbi:LysR family transcriptional regulator [Klebsiella pasteurii]|uniref:LysR family transcriptional regulator n=1 Tax=Klebsiella pasteurii TaxID=2587529 RepID=A0ABT5CQA7_9ENTR|nr:LysR family transcriptional regulator [Klebsiella pasteurii]MDC0693075.1 LysR family transcriptional regulator [Klebsiella pasteurii]MDC0754984.1 LysR family transcriptional regulator [Klebsiella pasteurii]MDQ2167701.1 LysR family transcriptional regulator [Klebsiella pasteurii]MDQ2201390.1 LysR family transcriptional regulator [Klebsiella pasteurii]MDQ2223015.1 LysR family transcriptional regulator [Klebsiella pasteurii]